MPNQIIRLAVPLIGCMFATACAPAENSSPEPTCASAPFLDPGPFEVGVMTTQLAGEPVEIWYPAAEGASKGHERESYDMRAWLPDEDAAMIPDEESPVHETAAFRGVEAAQGRFATVLFSHGLGGYRLQSSFLMTHLASWGLVVAAPEHPERGLKVILEGGSIGDDAPQTLRDTADLLRQLDGEAGHALEGRIDVDRLVVSGHSQGGSAVTILADDEDFAVDAWVGLATAIAPNSGAPPGLMIGGTLDQFATPNTMQTQWDDIVDSDVQRLIGIRDAGHMAFTDLCVIGSDRGGVLQIAIDHGVVIDDLIVDLASDGCQPEALDPQAAWPVINHYVTAHIFDALGEVPDGHASGLDSQASACFDDNVATYQEK
jgi:dienelactone hydrolase